MRDMELLLAPWNVTRFSTERAVKFHFHGVRLGGTQTLLGDNRAIPHHRRAFLLKPRFRELSLVMNALNRAGFRHTIHAPLFALLFRNYRRLWAVGRLVLPSASVYKASKKSEETEFVGRK